MAQHHPDQFHRDAGLAIVGDVPPSPQERAQARRDRERALRDPDRYYRAVHLAFRRQRGHGSAPSLTRPRPRGAGRPARRRTGSSSSTASADPGEGGDEPDAADQREGGRRDVALRVQVIEGDHAPGDAAVRRAFERIANEQRPGARWTVRP